MLAKNSLRARFPLATVCIETVLAFTTISVVGYSLLPLLGY